MNIYIIIFVIIILVFYCIQNNTENFESTSAVNQSLTGIDDANAINTLAQISTQLMAGGLTVPGNMNITGKLTVGSNLFSLPKGMIVAFDSYEAPEGWAICDGTKGTPDLRNRFIIGASPNTLGTIGGNTTILLAPNNLPPHKHMSLLINSLGPQFDWGSDKWLGNGNQAFSGGGSARLGSGGSPFLTGDGSQVDKSESGLFNKPIDILPPFYALTYIIKI
jgi:microcystin-dependent protein